MSVITTDIINSYRKIITPVVLLPQELFMKKILIITILIVLSFNFTYAFNNDPISEEMEQIPEYKEYFQDYAQRLYNNFHPEKHFFRTLGNGFFYVIRNDGTIENLEAEFSYNPKFTRYCINTIKLTKAYPFPKEIKDDYIVIELFFNYHNITRLEMQLYGRVKALDSIYWKKYYNLPSVNLVKLYMERKHPLIPFIK